MTAIVTSTVWTFFGTVATVAISTLGVIFLKRMERSNGDQHAHAHAERIKVENRLIDRLNEVHLDVITTNLSVGRVEGKVDAYVADFKDHVADVSAHGTKAA